MADTGKTILVLGVVGVGGYLLYEYSQYSTGVNAVAAAAVGPSGDPSKAVSSIEQTLPFMTYLQMAFGMTPATNLYNYIKSGAAGTLQSSQPQTPGTTPSMQQTGGQTSVTTTPTSTPNTTTPAPSGTMTTLAGNMAQAIGKTTATADEWDYAFNQIMGQAIDAKYGLNFDTVYGPAVNGVRNNGATMSALMFLQLAASAKGGSLPGLSGFGNIAQFGGPRYMTTGTMIYQMHHPFPYRPSFSGVGAYTQATGGERALWAGRRR